MRIARLTVLFASLCLIIPACSSTHPHDNFRNHMEYNIGLKADDPKSSIMRNPESYVEDRLLENGNIEKNIDMFAHAGIFSR